LRSIARISGASTHGRQQTHLHVRIYLFLFHAREPYEAQIREDQTAAGGRRVVHELEVEIRVV
jgi:hypothetical protein